MSFYRAPRTRQEILANISFRGLCRELDVPVRGRCRSLRDSWDDIRVRAQNNWKNHRRTHWRG